MMALGELVMVSVLPVLVIDTLPLTTVPPVGFAHACVQASASAESETLNTFVRICMATPHDGSTNASIISLFRL